MRYFRVKKELFIGKRAECETWDDGSLMEDAHSGGFGGFISLGFIVSEEDGSGRVTNVRFYPIETNTSAPYETDVKEVDEGFFTYKDNSEEVFKKIITDHPDSEWGNIRW